MLPVPPRISMASTSTETLIPLLPEPGGENPFGQGADGMDLDRGAFRDDQMDIGVNFLGDLATGGTSVTAIAVDPVQAVQRFGNRDGRQKPPDPFRSGEEERMRQGGDPERPPGQRARAAPGARGGN